MKKLFLVISLTLVACGDIFETDISGRSVEVIAPVDGVELTEGEVPFRWSTMEGVEKYRVTVVSPSFENARLAIRDTVLYQDSLATAMSFGFRLTLAPAQYEWSVQAFNFAYGSKKTVRSFTVVPKEPEETEEPEER